MKDDDEIKWFSFSNPKSEVNHIYNKWLKSMAEKMAVQPKHIGIDWAKDSGMNRGDIIKNDGNVTHVRFRTVTI